ncbi:MAG: alpha/beta hydrolase family protein [Planctomycetota bacterium]|jgi:pimeloyl-ACP methyl ester carboxylesterase
MSSRPRSTRVTTPDGMPMALDVYLPEEAAEPLPLTVICHGFKGFKDWGMFPPLAERLAANGRAVATFDYTHNGVGGTPGAFTRLDLFEQQTISRHVADLGTIIDFLDGKEKAGADFAEACGLQRNQHVNVVGHSMGGAVAMLRAAEDGRVVQVAALNSLAHLGRSTPEQMDELEREGRVQIRNARTGQDMPLGRAWFEDAHALDLEEAATQIFVPALVLCGDADTSVPSDDSREINQWIAGSRLVVVAGADHTFGARHPFAGWTPQLEVVANELDAFLPHVGRLGGI